MYYIFQFIISTINSLKNISFPFKMSLFIITNPFDRYTVTQHHVTRGDTSGMEGAYLATPTIDYCQSTTVKSTARRQLYAGNVTCSGDDYYVTREGLLQQQQQQQIGESSRANVKRAML